ncbi:xanthine dehydrogenase YagS FAD-binding subunit [Crossiella equi]|uniref:Xanthine dehydrogenase YagS FAD-binding subunit n=1 Tax=Crossiella equi TaxID=130796 RepID=A0ABS5APL0_9PSEU|nr:xanthine dehydrogenase family protein subunit M [Crossiella equi]MBP2478507.1 xanthine dehydrogenase YagS FAD-binding subunit [Crossiella equi]
MRQFSYERVDKVAEAVAAGARGATFLGGGTNLVDLMKLGVATPGELVDVRRLPLSGVRLTGGDLGIGATTTNSDAAAHPEIRRRFPALTQAILAGASGQIRNMATIGGNLLQRNRCGYFTDLSQPCNKRAPGGGCPAREGVHHNHAILGASEHCVATHASDMAVALTAFDAVVRYRTPAGLSEVPLVDFYPPVGDTPQRETVLPPGALITEIHLPALPVARNSRYRKVRERASYAFATVSVAAALDVHRGQVRDVRLALGGVASRPWRALAAETVLRGGPATPDRFRLAAQAELAAATPLAHNGYKVTLARNLIQAVLTDLARSAA